jgi:hypothetical protein
LSILIFHYFWAYGNNYQQQLIVYQWGASIQRAEIIPNEPAQGNACEGKELLFSIATFSQLSAEKGLSDAIFGFVTDKGTQQSQVSSAPDGPVCIIVFL